MPGALQGSPTEGGSKMRKNFGVKLEGEKGIRRLSTRTFLLDVNVRDQGRKREIFEGTLHEARVRLSVLKKVVKNKLPESGSLKFQTVREVLQYYHDQHFGKLPRAKSCKSIYRELLEVFGDCKLSKFTKEDFNKWLSEKQNGSGESTLRPATINNYIKTLKSAFNYCIANTKQLEINPIQQVKILAEENIQRKTINFNQFLALYNEMPDHLKPWLEFIYKVPTRRGEVISLRNPEDIDIENRKLYLPDERSKTKKGRALHMPASMMDYFRNIPSESKWVFYRPEKTDIGMVYHPLDGKGVYQALRRVAKRLNMDGIHVHMFRRTAAVNMMKAGINLNVIQQAGGWKKLDVLTERYLPLSDAIVQEAVDKVDVPVREIKLSA